MNIFESKNKAYTDLFLRNVVSFLEQYSLIRKEETLHIACSAGVDSMVLVHILYMLKRFGYSNDLNIIHINHGTRDENLQEERLVQNFAKHLGLPVTIKKLSGLNGLSNFEKIARDLRYESFKEVAGNEKIVFAHHIDDSYEWSLMQSSGSSNLESSLGIPVINGQIIRPFMCVTKAQIRKYAKLCSIPFLEDPTNITLDYDRNFVRTKVISQIKKRYPSYLKHYVNSKNELARKLGLHAIKEISSFKLKYNKDSVELFSEKSCSITNGLEIQIQKAVHHLSDAHRGQIQKQLKNAMIAINNNKQGPITFSGGVNLVLSYNHLFLYPRGYKFEDSDYLRKELSLKHSYLQIGYEQFRKIVLKIINDNGVIAPFPIWVIIEKNNNWVVSQKRIHPLWPKLTGHWLEKKVSFISALALLKQWEKKSNSTKLLRLRFLSPVKLDLYT